MTITERSKTIGGLKAGFATLAAATLTLFGIVPAHADDDVINIPDDRLRACILEELSLDGGDDITATHVPELTSLNHCSGHDLSLDARVADLTGLEHFTSLRALQVNSNNIVELGPLEDLTSLRALHMSDNNVSDLTPLAGLNLTELFFNTNSVTDLAPLGDMNALQGLGFSRNGVSDLEPLKGLTVLEQLRLDDNEILDLSPLAGLGSLTQLWLRNNSITDVSPLTGLESLNHVRLDDNHITDVSRLPDSIDTLDVTGQSVDLGELTAGEPQSNPVVGFDRQPVALTGDLYDGDENEFTPAQDGPLSIAWEDGSGDFSGTLSFTLEPVPFDPLEVEVSAQPAYGLRYGWDVTLDGWDVVVPYGAQTVEVDYEMVVTPSGPTSEGFRIRGAVTVTNDNPVAIDGVTITVVPEGSNATCEVPAGDGVAVPAGDEVGVTYWCDLPDDTATDAQVAVTATATWDEGTYSGSGGTASDTADFGDASPSTYGQLRELMIEGHQIDGAPVWFRAGDGQQSHAFVIEWAAPDGGQCADVTIQGGLGDDNVMLERAADATVTICVEAPLQVAKNPTASFDRHYLWDIDKSVTTDGAVDERGEATFDYVVEAQAAGFTDSGWAIAGQIEVHNPNTFGQITFDVAEATDLGGQCALEESTAITLAGGDAIALGYECLFDAAPDYTTTSTATVTWTDPAGDAASASGSADALFEVDGETDRVVQVWDDHTDPANPVLLGEADWFDSGTWTFEYSLVLPGVVGGTVTFTNTAWIEATGESPQASTTVEISIDTALEPAPGAAPESEPEDEPATAQAAAAESGLPATGAPMAGAGLLALLLTAGGLTVLANRRQAQN